MSNINNEQLFTELTSEEASVVEGGLAIIISSMQAIRAGADTFGADDTYITADGRRIFGPVSFSSGQSRSVGAGAENGRSSIRINLFDEDGFLGGGDDSLGGFTARNTNGAQVRARVSGSGSTYDVFYRAFA